MYVRLIVRDSDGIILGSQRGENSDVVFSGQDPEVVYGPFDDKPFQNTTTLASGYSSLVVEVNEGDTHPRGLTHRVINGQLRNARADERIIWEESDPRKKVLNLLKRSPKAAVTGEQVIKLLGL